MLPCQTYFKNFTAKVRIHKQHSAVLLFNLHTWYTVHIPLKLTFPTQWCFENYPPSVILDVTYYATVQRNQFVYSFPYWGTMDVQFLSINEFYFTHSTHTLCPYRRVSTEQLFRNQKAVLTLLNCTKLLSKVLLSMHCSTSKRLPLS